MHTKSIPQSPAITIWKRSMAGVQILLQITLDHLYKSHLPGVGRNVHQYSETWNKNIDYPGLTEDQSTHNTKHQPTTHCLEKYLHCFKGRWHTHIHKGDLILSNITKLFLCQVGQCRCDFVLTKIWNGIISTIRCEYKVGLFDIDISMCRGLQAPQLLLVQPAWMQLYLLIIQYILDVNKCLLSG